MRTVTPLDLRKRLGQILDAASAGERFVIERNRRPLAMLLSIEDGRRLDDGDAEERYRRRLGALQRLEALGDRFAHEHPSPLSSPGALRLDRDRDDPGPDRATDA